MEITWYGHSCFKFSERGLATVVADPYDHQLIGHKALNLDAEIVTISHAKPGHNHISAVNGSPFIISGPGEYEIGGVFVTGIQTNDPKGSTTPEDQNTLYVFDYNGINVAHLGGLNRVPSQREIQELGPIHIALVPIGGTTTLNAAKASEIVHLLEPNIVIPMHYMTKTSNIKLDPLGKFLKEMGSPQIEAQEMVKLSNVRSLPEETQMIVLETQVS